MLLVTVFLLAIICAGSCILIWRWKRTKKKKYILFIPSFVFWILGFWLLVFLSPAIIFIVEDTKLFYCPNPFNKKLELIELDRLRKFSEYYGGYDYTVLIRNPLENADSLKKVMTQYFIETKSYIDSAYPGHRLNNVDFYRYTCRTGYFIDNDEDREGFLGNQIVDTYYDAKIGSISAQYCNDPTKYKYIFVKMHNEEIDKYQLECDGVHIDNWDMYIK